MTACIVNGKRCTSCCKAIRLDKDAVEHLPFNTSEDAVFVLNNWVRITTDEAFNINPYLKKRFSEYQITTGVFFKCNHSSENGCSVYNNRPPICRGYPMYSRTVKEFTNIEPEYDPQCNQWPTIKVVNV